ncbi:hypothetical protein Goshw_020138, partial [Gossypium schwendimanii]|nr:hypothetical protein [Gossypium schwendimanii]
SEYQILETYIHNLPAPPSSLIEQYLKDVGFLHMDRMGMGCKLNPTLVRVLVERWRSETHAFHLPCGECTMTLEDMQLQLRLSMDGSVVIGSVVTVDWRDVCEQLLGKVPNAIYEVLIDMNWLKINFGELDTESNEVEREQHTWSYIFMIIEGFLMPNKSQNFVHLRWLLKLVNFSEAGELSWGSSTLVTLYPEM